MLGVAFFSVNMAPYIMWITNDEERRHAFGVFQATFPAAGFLGSLVAGILPGLIARRTGMTLDDPEPYRMALMFGPIMVLLALIPLSGAERCRLSTSGLQLGRADNVPVGALVLFGIIVFLAAIGESAARGFFNVYLNIGLGVPTAQIGVIMAMAQLLPIAAALSTPLLMARLGTGYAYISAILALSVFLIGLAAFPVLAAAALSYMGASAAITMLAAVARSLWPRACHAQMAYDQCGRIDHRSGAWLGNRGRGRRPTHRDSRLQRPVFHWGTDGIDVCASIDGLRACAAHACCTDRDGGKHRRLISAFFTPVPGWGFMLAYVVRGVLLVLPTTLEPRSFEVIPISESLQHCLRRRPLGV